MHTRTGRTRIADLLEDRARLFAGSDAYVDAATGDTLSWSSLEAMGLRWRELAADLQLPSRSRVGLVITNPLAFSGAYIACLAAGLSAVPIDPRLPGAQVLATSARLRVDVIATDRVDLIEGDAPHPVLRIGVRDVRLVRGRRASAWPSGGAALRPAAVLASSGTSGAPKVVPLEEWQLIAAASRIARHHHLGRGDRGYTPLPLFHVNAQVVGLLSALVSGSTLVVDTKFHASDYWNRVAEWRPTWLNTVPAMLATLTELAPPAEALARSLRFARSASAPLRVDIESRFERLTGVGVLQTYGMTEVASQLTANPLDELARRRGSVGLPVGVEISVRDRFGGLVATGTPGMVHVRGAGVISSYLVVSDVTAERTRPARDANGWLPTGDVGWLADDGFLHLLGRVDDVINRGGEKLYPAEIERMLVTNPNVAAAIVVGMEHERLGQVPVAFVVRRTANAMRDDDLAHACASALPPYKRPASIRRLHALPIGPTGKPLRKLAALEAAAA